GGGPSGQYHGNDPEYPKGIVGQWSRCYGGRFAIGQKCPGLGRFYINCIEKCSCDPGHIMSHVHARGGSPSCRGFFGKPENGQVGHTDVHGRIGEPGPEHHMPKRIFYLSGKGVGTLSPDVPKITETMDLQLSQGHNTACQKGNYNDG